MAPKIEELSTKELNALISAAKKRKTLLAKRKPIAAVRKRLQKAAQSSGYTLEELFGGSAVSTRAAAPSGTSKPSRPARKYGKVAPKYRNPENASETWSGRGRTPLWLVAKVDAGKPMTDFLIEKPEAPVLSAAGVAAASYIEP